MNNLRLFYKNLSNYFDVVFFVKFMVLMTVFYYFNVFYIGITDAGGRLYSGFLANHLDYISWLRTSILLVSQFISKGLGLQTVITDVYTLKAVHGPSVIIGFTCLGYGLMSFWAAFIIAQDTGWKKKIVWTIAGMAGIWFINCWRVAVLLLALTHKWKVNKYIDHHDMFNIVAYVLMIGMIFLYYKQNKSKKMGDARRPTKAYDLKMPITTEMVNS